MKYLQFIIFFFFVQLSFAQVPSAFSYQGLLFDADGSGIENKEVEFIITLSSDNTGATVYYQELQIIETDENGVFDFNIGEGSILSGSMDDVDWLVSVPYIGVEYDLNDGEDIQSLGFTQFKSVPFCLHAKYVVCQDGPVGEIGSQGLMGNTGPTGFTGAGGINGIDGADGADGQPFAPMLNSPPSFLEVGTVYLDNGNNTEDGVPGLRYWDGTVWIQL